MSTGGSFCINFIGPTGPRGPTGSQGATGAFALPIPATDIANGSVDNTEFQYLNGVTGPIQDQLDDKWDVFGNAGLNASNNFLGTTDGTDLVFRVANSEQARILTNANAMLIPGAGASITSVGHGNLIAAGAEMASSNISTGHSNVILGNRRGNLSISGYAHIIAGTNSNTDRDITSPGGASNGIILYHQPNGTASIIGGSANLIMASTVADATISNSGASSILSSSNDAIISGGGSNTIFSSSGSSTMSTSGSGNGIHCVSGGTRGITGASSGSVILANSSGTSTINGNGSAIIAVQGNLNRTVLCNASTIMATASAAGITGAGNSNFIAAAGGNITGGSRNAIIAASGSQVNPAHNNAAVIGALNMTSQADNAITTSYIYSNAGFFTCDGNKKKDIKNYTSNEGTPELSAQIMGVTAKSYRFVNEDELAPLHYGFEASELEQQFPECVKRTYRKIVEVTKTDDKWVDEHGNLYTEKQVVINQEDKLRGTVSSDEPLEHAFIDATAMMSMLFRTIRHLQIQVSRLQNP